MCRSLLCLCRPFMIFEGCLDSNPEYCRTKLARYHPSTSSNNVFNVVSKSVKTRHEVQKCLSLDIFLLQ